MIDIVPFVAENHLAGVLDLLATSLPSVAKEEVFRWKHLDGPFGPSPGYLAFLDGRMVGVRFFMPWEFMHNGLVVKGYRPVDTVTHPDARGMGVFKRLTLHGLDQLVEDGKPLIFNTPNGNSLPGYLKMGWVQYRQPLVYRYRPVNFLTPTLQLTTGNRPTEVPLHDFQPDCIETNKSPAFVKWRYGRPGYIFSAPREEARALMVAEIFKKGPLQLLNVVDYVGDTRLYAQLVNSTARARGAHAIREVTGADYLPASMLSLKRGSSLVAMRADTKTLTQRFYFSIGDLQSIL